MVIEMKKRRVIVKLLIFVFVLEAVFYKGSLFLSAAVSEGQNMVRVGLVKEYLNKTNIRINNIALKIGFSKENVYYPTDILRDGKGISISRAYGSYNVYGGSFPSYAKALAEAASLRAAKKSLTVVPALVGMDRNNRGVWKLYDAYLAENVLNTNDVYSIAAKNKSSKFMLAVTIDRNKFLIDVKEAGANPQFESVNK